MIKNFRTIAMAASVPALCFLASCVKKDPASAPDPDPVPGVELVNESDKEISVTAVALEDYEVLINFVDGLNRDDIAVTVPEGIDWCSASLSEGKDAVGCPYCWEIKSENYDGCVFSREPKQV